MTDLALARRMLAGDEAALNEFFAEFLPRLYRFALVRLSGNDDATEEVVQATMTRAVLKLQTYRGEAAMFTWLCTLCRKDPAAVVERVQGGTAALPTGRTLPIGEWIETAADSRAALRVDGRASMRLDVSSRARLLDATTIELERGAVYVDTGADLAAFEVRTRLGIARDVGTQFEVRLHDDALRIRVRSGLVELHRPGGTTAVRGGSEVTVAGDRVVSRQMPPFGPEWRWAAQLAAPFDIEGQPLSTFLEHISREQGWVLRCSIDKDVPRIEPAVASLELHVDAMTAALPFGLLYE